MPKPVTKKATLSINYLELSSELDELLAWFESNDFNIDESERKYERAMEIIFQLEAKLSQVENAVEKIKLKFSSA